MAGLRVSPNLSGGSSAPVPTQLPWRAGNGENKDPWGLGGGWSPAGWGLPVGAALGLVHQACTGHFPDLTTALGKAVGRTGACSRSAHHCIAPFPLRL